MAHVDIIISGQVTLDESSGLQNTSIPGPGEDNNDSDALYTALPNNFSTYLFTTLGLPTTFPDRAGVGESPDGFISVDTEGNVTSLFFSDGSGNPLPAYGDIDPGIDSGIDTLANNDILLFGDQDGQVVLGVEDSTGHIVFAAYLDASTDLTSAKVWTVQFEALYNPDGLDPDDPVNLGDALDVAATADLLFNFEGTPSGKNLFTMVGSHEQGLVVTPDSEVQQLNTSHGGGPTTLGLANQMIDGGETMVFTFVNDPVENYTVPNLDQHEARDENSIQFGSLLPASGASVVISQVQGGAPASMLLTAYDTDTIETTGDGFIDGYADDDPVEIAAVRVYDGAGILLVDTGVSPSGGGVTVDLTGKTALLAGIDDDYRIEFDASAEFQRLAVSGVSGKFDIGGIGITETDAAHVNVGDHVRFEDGCLSGGTDLIFVVEEDDINNTQSTGINEDLSVNAHIVTGSIVGAIFADVDEPATYALTSDFTALLAQGLTSKGAPLSYHVNPANDLLTAFVDTGPAGFDAGDREVFTFSLATNGDFTFTQIDQMDHTAGDGENWLNVNLSTILHVTDADMDTLIGSGENLVFRVQDDIPDLSGTTESVDVDEDEIHTGLSDGSDTSTGPGPATASGTLAGLVMPGTDEPASFKLKADTSGLPALSSKGDPISYQVNTAGDLLTGYVDLGEDRTVFTLTLAVNGAYIFTAFDQFDHAAGDGRNVISIDFSSMVEASDYDLDTINLPASAFIVTVTDDIPTIGPISDGLVDFVNGDSVTNPLNGVEGADDDAIYTIEAFTGDDETVTINDVELTVVRSPDKSLVSYFFDGDGNGVYTPGSPMDQLYYTLALSADDYTFTVHTDPPPVFQAFDFNFLPSGQNLFGMVGSTDSAILVVGQDPDLDEDGKFTNQSDTINTSHGGGDTTIGVNNQMFDPGEGAYFTYVFDPEPNYLSGHVPGGLSQGEADDADNILYGEVNEVAAAFLQISQTQGPDPVAMTIAAFNIDGDPMARDFINFVDVGPATRSDGVGITAVRVYSSADFTLDPIEEESVGDGGVPTIDDPDVDIVFNSDGTVTVSGLGEDMAIEWMTAGEHDQSLVTGVEGKFDIGLFGISEILETPDQLFEYTVQIEDYDHDLAADTFLIGIDGTGTNDDGHVDGLFA